MQNLIATGFILIFSFNALVGQYFKLETGINGFFDNREYQNPYDRPHTMFGSSMQSTANIYFNDFHFGAGLSFLYEFGHHIDNQSFKPLIYAKYTREFIDFRFGSFPNEYMFTFPEVLRTDTFQYYHSNCEGAYLELKQKWGSQSVWVDWLSKQTASDREIFQIGGSGIIKKGVFFYRHDFIMTHYAHSANRPPDSYLRDNGGLLASLGADMSDFLFDSLTITTGYTMSYDRIRGRSGIEFRHGSMTKIYIGLSGFAIRESIYLGNGQLQLWGDKLYGAEYYYRTDLIWHFFNRKYIKGSLEFSVHLVESDLDFSQSITINANLPSPEIKIQGR